MVRTGVVIPKHKFCAHGAPKHTSLLFQYDIPIDLARHGSNLIKQVSSGTQNSSPSQKRAIYTTETVSFNNVLLEVTGTWRSPFESPAGITLRAKPGLVGKHHTSPQLQCPQCMLSTPS
ncbi:uncharacterized protein TNCV_3681051 [Trichonephila clavipes]|uniref:Uncharacterized protein n=1 Tax=Trichonephila clavipes TaxID=2585209 RepID=A0A8X6RFB6_TRICX|nr:uncharacterized protein TNCV_3681051 [Trichonephila clavipes]